MWQFVFIFKPRFSVNSFSLPAEIAAYSIGPISEFACSACHRIRSREGAFEIVLEDENGPDRAVYVCAECLDELADADRVADEVMRMMEAAEAGGEA